jgi:hypothetical protein
VQSFYRSPFRGLCVIEWTRHPELMQKLKQQRVEAEQKLKKQQQ